MLTFRRCVSIGLAFLCSVFSTLPSAEVEALREIFQVASLPWDQGQDPCGLPQVQCDKGNQTTESLILHSLKLSWLPDSIGRLQSLESLHLQDNQLRSLPESIAQLKSLAVLFLNGNQLTALPVSVSQLPSLRELWLDNNYLTMLPDCVGQMKSLTSLYLKSNQVTSLPESMGQLQQLLILDLDGNQLTMLPEPLTNLPLKYLLLASNQLMSLPESIAALQSLQVLRLPSNKLTSLPETISQLQNLINLDLHNNRLASLPDSIGNLKALRVLSLDSNRLNSLPESIANLSLGSLFLDSNRLSSIPHLMSPYLLELRVAKNRLNIPPDLGQMMRLHVLSLHNNFLERLPPQSLTCLKHLKVALLHSNQIREPTEICQLGQGLRLETLYLHSNALRGNIPPCLSQFKSLEVLTLHRNALTGEVPKSLLGLPNLGVLTLHGNRLYGNLPLELATAPKLFFFSAHSNRFEGPIPPLHLRKDCVNDESFLSDFDSCDDFTVSGLWALECRSAEIALRCPKACGMCDNASARGPVLLLHDNRLSCSLPEEVTGWPKDVRSISLVGNLLGNGSHALPDWIHTDEHQPFLYISGNRSSEMLKRAFLLASMCTLCWLLLVAHSGYGHIWLSKAGTELTRKAHRFLLQMGGILSAVAMFLLLLYRADATYYLCGSSFSSTTVSNFSKPYRGHALIEWAVAILWAVWIAVGAFFLRHAPTPRVAMVGEAMSWLECFLKFVYSCCWLCVVAVLSFPSVAYAVVSAIPHNNTMQLSAWWLQFFHYQAALVMVLVDMFITPKAVAFFADATGMRRSMLFMAARLGTMWLAAVLSTIYLTTHCMNGWTQLWKVSGCVFVC